MASASTRRAWFVLLVTLLGCGSRSGLDDERAPSPPAVLYAQSMSALYTLDPASKNFDEVGPFRGCGGDVYDLAVNDGGELLAVADRSDAVGYTLSRVDPRSGACTQIGLGDRFVNALAFAPRGVIADAEVLVGFSNADYLAINPATGAATVLRADALPTALSSSGDVVILADGRGFLTVTGTADGADCSVQDCLVEFDARSGTLRRNWGTVGYAAVYGLAYADGMFYGFTESGAMFRGALNGTTFVPTSLAQGPSFGGAAGLIAP